jgi:hypothetical protein
MYPGVQMIKEHIEEYKSPVGSLPDPPDGESPEEAVRRVTTWLTKQINDQFVGSINDEKTRDAIKGQLDSAVAQLKAGEDLPEGVEISNARLEGDVMKMDIVLPSSAFPPDLKWDITLGGEGSEVVKEKDNMIRLSAPWKTD